MAAKTAKPATPSLPSEQPIERYGIRPVPGKGQLFYDMVAFGQRLPVDFGAPPRPILFRRITDKLLPRHFEWHSWTERMVDAACEGGSMPAAKGELLKKARLIGVPGCSNSAKTHNISGFAVAWWLCKPMASSVMLVSTSRDSLRKRAWAQVERCYSAMTPRFGNMLSSRMVWKIDGGDDLHAIFGKAVEEGSVSKVADDIKGIHTERQMVIIDEATSVPEAIFDACTNLYSYPQEFVMVVLGNPRTRLDQFGKWIEPLDGWKSIDVESEEWEGKPQPEFGGMPVRVIRFDAEKSPNILEGKLVSRHLPTKEVVEAKRTSAGGQTPLWWSNFRGFPPPDGLCKTVFTETSIISNNGFGKFKFTGEDFQILGAFDHARAGGDRPVIRFAKMGKLDSGRTGIELLAPKVLSVNVNSKNPIEFQLADQVRKLCLHFDIAGQHYACPFANLIVDGTGEGAGFVDIAQRTISNNIQRVVFSWAASEDACSLEDLRPAKDVYQNKAVEMYFRAKYLLEHGQLCGIDRETAIELCTREYDDDGRKIQLMSKKDYKEKYKASPDLADTVVLIVEMARRKGLRLAPIGETVKRYDDWHEQAEAAQQVYATAEYRPEEQYVEEEPMQPVESFV